MSHLRIKECHILGLKNVTLIKFYIWLTWIRIRTGTPWMPILSAQIILIRPDPHPMYKFLFFPSTTYLFVLGVIKPSQFQRFQLRAYNEKKNVKPRSWLHLIWRSINFIRPIDPCVIPSEGLDTKIHHLKTEGGYRSWKFAPEHSSRSECLHKVTSSCIRRFKI